MIFDLEKDGLKTFSKNLEKIAWEFAEVKSLVARDELIKNVFDYVKDSKKAAYVLSEVNKIVDIGMCKEFLASQIGKEGKIYLTRCKKGGYETDCNGFNQKECVILHPEKLKGHLEMLEKIKNIPYNHNIYKSH
jgi:hypothetical protein